MLVHEEDVEENGEEAEAELGGVAKDGAPVVVVVGDDEHLADAEEPAGEVEHDVADAPADGAFPEVVHVGLMMA